MDTLPIELQNEIWNIYWKGEFKDHVLDKLNDINDKILKMNFFLDKHFYANKCTGYDYMISHYLRQYNDLLNTIRKENGLYIYISATNANLSLCFNHTYIRSCFSKVAHCYKEICVYCLCNGVPYMSGRIVERFINLSKKVNKK